MQSDLFLACTSIYALECLVQLVRLILIHAAAPGKRLVNGTRTTNLLVGSVELNQTMHADLMSRVLPLE